MFEPLKLSIKSFYGLKDLELEITKTILYGPNAVGKSRAIYALTLILNANALPEQYGYELADIDVTVEFGNKQLSVRGGKFICGKLEGSYESVDYCIRDFFKPIEKFALVGYDGMFTYGRVGGGPPEETSSPWDLGFVLKNAEEVEMLELSWAAFTSARRFYRDRVRISSGWINANALSFGEKKTMIIQYFARLYDVVMIESFEGGLHADLAVGLLEWLDENSRYVVIETHSGVILRRAVERGWRVYYLDGKRVTEVTKDNVTNIELFRRELGVYL